jgi:uncharacterized protein (TIGR04255 family)
LLPSTFDSPPANLILRSEFRFPQYHGRLVLTLATAPSDSIEVNIYILDLDFITTDASVLSFDTAEQWVEVAHDQIEIVFEASITDTLREKFAEVKP